MKRGMKYFLTKFPVLLISILLIIIINRVAPLPNTWWWFPAVLIVALAVNSINNTYQIIARYVKKDWSVQILYLLFGEIMLFFFLIIMNINRPIQLLVYVPLFWIASGLMRICIDATTFVYKAKEKEVLNFFKNFAKVRISFFFILLFLGLMFYYDGKENIIEIIVAIPLFSIWLLGTPIAISHPVLRYIIFEDKTKIEIRIRKALHKKELTTNNLFKSLNIEDFKEFENVLNNLKSRRVIEHIKRRWKLRLLIKKSRSK